jgi:hypothetical protein
MVALRRKQRRSGQHLGVLDKDGLLILLMSALFVGVITQHYPEGGAQFGVNHPEPLQNGLLIG